MKILAYSILFSLFLHSLHGQERTVGLQKKTDDAFYPGYTLFSPAGNTTTYLINECGQMVHSWESQYSPGNAVYLQPDGSIYRASRVDGAILGEPGVGGRIERISWEGNVIWSWEYSSDTVNHHHDFLKLWLMELDRFILDCISGSLPKE